MKIVVASLLMNELKFRFQIPLINKSQFRKCQQIKRKAIAFACIACHLLEQPACEAVEREGGQTILPRPILPRFARSPFPFPSPSDACHAG